MSDRIAVFNRGRIEQVGRPAEVYEHPASEFIAGLRRRLERHRAGGPPDDRAAGEDPTSSTTARAVGRVRTWRRGSVRDVQYVGPVTRYHVTLDRGGELQVLAQNLEESSGEVLATKGRRVRLQWRPEQESAIVEREEGDRMSERKRRLGLRAALLAARRSARRRGSRMRRRRRAPRRRRSRASAPRSRRSRRWRGREGRSTSSSGRVTRSSTDEFEEATGLQVNKKIGNTSDDMVSLIQTGDYDGVSASGNASVRLMAGGDVAPIDTELIPNYADVRRASRTSRTTRVDGQPYGVPHGRGPNLPDVAHGRRHAGAGQLGRRLGRPTRRTRARSRSTTTRSSSPTRRCTSRRPSPTSGSRTRTSSTRSSSRPPSTCSRSRRRTSASTGPSTPNRSSRSRKATA